MQGSQSRVACCTSLRRSLAQQVLRLTQLLRGGSRLVFLHKRTRAKYHSQRGLITLHGNLHPLGRYFRIRLLACIGMVIDRQHGSAAFHPGIRCPFQRLEQGFHIPIQPDIAQVCHAYQCGSGLRTTQTHSEPVVLGRLVGVCFLASALLVCPAAFPCPPLHVDSAGMFLDDSL